MVSVLRFSSALLLIAPVVLLLIAVGSRRTASKSCPVRALTLIYALPVIAPLLFTFLWRLDATRIMIELHGIAFRTEGNDPIRKSAALWSGESGRLVVGQPIALRGAPY